MFSVSSNTRTKRHLIRQAAERFKTNTRTYFYSQHVAEVWESLRQCSLCQKPVLVPKLITTPISRRKKKHGKGSKLWRCHFNLEISTTPAHWKPGKYSYFSLLYTCSAPKPLAGTCDWSLLETDWWPNSSFLQCTWWPGFQFLYNIASYFKMAVSPLTLKRNQCQKYPYGYFVFFLHKREFYLINKTSNIYFFLLTKQKTPWP